MVAALTLRALAVVLLAPRGFALSSLRAEEATEVESRREAAVGRHLSANLDGEIRIPESVRCYQHENLTLPAGIEIRHAWYGSPIDGFKRVDITDKVKKQYNSGNPTIFALNELYGNHAPWTTKVLEVNYVRVKPSTDRAVTEKPRSPHGVTMMVQIGNDKYWDDLKRCASHVSEAIHGAGEGFELFLSFHAEVNTERVDSIVKDAQAEFGTSSVRSIVAPNRGADIGLFLNQLKTLDAEGSGKHFDLFLKVHSKSDQEKRERWLDRLCGSPDKVSRIHRAFRDFNQLGMVGPATEVIEYPHRNEEFVIWDDNDMQAMERTWKMMQPCIPFNVPLQHARIVAGSFFWTQQDAVLYDVILRSADELLKSMPDEYVTGSTATTAHALERLIPTMVVAVQGLRVLPDDGLKDLWKGQANPDDDSVQEDISSNRLARVEDADPFDTGSGPNSALWGAGSDGGDALASADGAPEAGVDIGPDALEPPGPDEADDAAWDVPAAGDSSEEGAPLAA